MTKGSLGRSLRAGATLAAVLVAVAVAAVYVWGEVMERNAPPPERALLVFSNPDEDGTRVAWVVIDLDLEARTMRAVDTSTSVSIPGTSYSIFRDAFAFGGGGAVADVYSRVASAPVLPALEISEEDWVSLVGDGAGVGVRVPVAVNVFTGEELVGVSSGTTTVTGDSIHPLLLASAYLSPEEAAEVRFRVTEATAKALRAHPGLLAELAEARLFRGSMPLNEQPDFGTRAAAVLSGSEFVAPE